MDEVKIIEVKQSVFEGNSKNAVNTVIQIAKENKIEFITLEVGESSTFVPAFFEKLFPVAIDGIKEFEGASLKMVFAPGKSLIIKEIGY